ncbi:acetamidase/formamidase family protein [Hoeflea olei]|uniref:Acetamidase n=1 Tax=Hoeflea olei TaxID=1480615 RepID=A0A1C1YTS6_9HYPH|nr:acetamidase/formamidase family protein [Hoeflea olei]OCW56933.1 acetamidase [Hoeflea olei]
MSGGAAAWRTIHSGCCHSGWDRSLAPVIHVAPGETIELCCRDAADGHYTQASTAADIARMDLARVNLVTGPVFVDGAEPGDTLKVTIGEFSPSGFGWSAIIPGFGLLADQFTAPRLHLWTYDRTARTPAVFSDIARVPLKPFAGTIGVAPVEPGRHDILPPYSTGGNMDIRDLAAGTELYLPVKVRGALFSVGDTHAAQGDGEVCGTAIESAMDIVVTLDLIKGGAPPFPRFSTPGPVTRHLDAAGYEVTTGIGPDLMRAARDAVSGMIDHLGSWRGIAPEDAYMLCSVCGDLRISEVVDAPHWVVSFYFPRIVFA